MYNARQNYQRQSVMGASPEKLIAKLYDVAISACHRGDRTKVRSALVELLSSLNAEEGGELVDRLRAVYEFCLNESATGDLDLVRELLDELRDAWRMGVVQKQQTTQSQAAQPQAA